MAADDTMHPEAKMPGRQRRPIFVINLKQDVKRLASMKQQLDDRKLSYEVIEAVDGHLIPEQEVEKINTQSLQRIIAPEAGCYRSHIKAFQTMVERQLPEAIILEDDIRLNEDFAAVINDCELPEKCRVLHLSGNNHNVLQEGDGLYDYCSRFHERPLPNGYKMSCHIGIMYGVRAYIMSLAYARQLVQEAKCMKVRVDHLLFDWHYNLYLPWMVYKKSGASNYRMLAEQSHSEIPGNRTHNSSQRDRQMFVDVAQFLSEKGNKLPRRKRTGRLPVFIIHREGNAKDLAAIKQQLDAGEVPFELVPAVDQEQAAKHPRAVSETSHPRPDSSLSVPQITRYLSHLEAYRAVLETGAPEAIILEDDILLDESFPAWFHGKNAQEYRMPNMVYAQFKQLNPARKSQIYFSPYKLKPLMHSSYRLQEDLHTKGIKMTDIHPGICDFYTQAYIIHRSHIHRIFQGEAAMRKPLPEILFRYKYNRYKITILLRRKAVEILSRFRTMLLHRYPELLNLDEKPRIHARRFVVLQYLKLNLGLYSFAKLLLPGRKKTPHTGQ